MSWEELDKARAAVFRAALVVGRHWNDQDGVNAQYIDALAKHVAEFDEAAKAFDEFVKVAGDGEPAP